MDEKQPRGERSIGLKSEFNMSVLDMERIDAILRRCDEYALLCGEGTHSYLIPYVNGLNAFLRYMIPLMKDDEVMKYKMKVLTIRKLIYERGQYTWETFFKTEQLHEDLLRLRQWKGLGVWAKRDEVFAEKYLKNDKKEKEKAYD